MKKLLVPAIVTATIMTLLLNINVVNSCLTDPKNEKPNPSMKQETICEPVILTQEYKNICTECIVELAKLKALYVERLNTHTIKAKIQSTNYWNALDITEEQMLGIALAIFVVNPKITQIIMSIGTTPLLKFTYDGSQICATCLNTR